MATCERDLQVSETRSVALARLRRVRLHAQRALLEPDRRSGGVTNHPSRRDAHSIATEQLRLVGDAQGDVVEPLVLDLARLAACADARVAPVRAFTERILQERALRRSRGKLFLRHEDLDTLSVLLDCPPEVVTTRLGGLGLLG